MTRTLRWKRSFYQWRLSPKGRGDELPYLLWPPLDPGHQWWSLPARSGPSLWADQRWQEWSRSCLPSNWLRWVGRSQSPLIDLSTDEWVPAKIEGHRKAYASPLSMPNTRHSPWHRPRRRAWGLASSTSEPAARGSFRCQNGPPEDRRDDGWLVLCGWPRAQKVGPGGAAPHQLPRSLLGLVASILEPRNWSPAVPAAGASCYQCWPNKVSHRLPRFRASSRTGEAMEEREFRR